MILLAGWLVFIVYAYPGVCTMDSFDQLKEGRAWFFTDSHPPIMAAIWGILDRIVAGPLPMLVLQSTMFLAGLYLLLKRAMAPRSAAIVTCVLLLFPPVLVPMAMIWKDCHMAGFLLLGTAGILDSRRNVKLLGLGALVLATALRYNALGATLPLVVLLFEWAPGKRWLARYAIAIGTWFAVVVVAFSLNALLTDRKMHFWHSSMALADIVGTLAHVDEDIPDAELLRVLGPTQIRVQSDVHGTIRRLYKPHDFQQLISGEQRLWDVNITGDVPTPEPQRDAIGAAWKEIVFGNLGAHVAYRFDNFAETLGLRKEFHGATVVPHHWQYQGMLEYMGLTPGATRLQRKTHLANLWLAKHTPLFRPHVYMLLAVLLLALAWRHRDVLAILASGLCMELTMLPLGGTPDYRYSHWMVVCTCLGVVMLFARRRATRDATSKPA